MKKRRAVVTGAGTGIGKGIAVLLGRAGYTVVVHYNNSKEGAYATCDIIEREGGKAYAVQADLSSVEGVNRLFDTAMQYMGGLELYVNNSGITQKSKIEETTEEFFDRMIQIDLKSAYFCIQRAAKEMIHSKIKGNMVIIASNNAYMQRPELSVYGSIKAALIKLGKHAAVEFARFGIRVNMIAPGWTMTPRTLKNDMEKTYSTIPLKRWCTPEEIGQMVLFYDSDAAASITGNCIVADGGSILMNDVADKYGL